MCVSDVRLITSACLRTREDEAKLPPRFLIWGQVEGAAMNGPLHWGEELA